METPWNDYIVVREYINNINTPSIYPEEAVVKIEAMHPRDEIDEETSMLPIDIKVLFHEFFMAGLEAVLKAVDKQIQTQLYDFLYKTVHLRQEIPSAHPTAESSTPHPTSDPETLAIQLMHEKWKLVEHHCINEDHVLTQVRQRLSHLLGGCTFEKYLCIQATIKAETNSKARELAAKLFGSHFPLYSVSEALHDCIDEHVKEALETEESNKLLGDDKDLILEMIKMLKQFTEITLKANLGDILDGTSFTAEFMVSSECRHADIKFKDTSELKRQLKIKLVNDPSCLSKVHSLTERTGKRTREEQQESEAEGLGKEELRVIERLKKEDVTRQEKVEQLRKDEAAMPAALKPDASPQLIDKLFKSTPAQLIPKLAATFKSWLTDDKGDMEKSLQEAFPIEQIPQIDFNKLQLKKGPEKEVLGSGSFGEVQKGVYTNEGEKLDVAVKAVRDVAFLTEHMDQKLSKELLEECQRMLKCTEHPNVVSLYGYSLDVYTESRFLFDPKAKPKFNVYLVMELCDETLWDFIKRVGDNLSHKALLEIANQIVNGMTFVADNNITHRDLRSANILVQKKGRDIKIGDFGLSRIMHDIMGSAACYHGSTRCRFPQFWSAPESLDETKRIWNEKSDVWSFGVVMIELYTAGKVPSHSVPPCHRANINPYEQPHSCPDVIYDELILKCWESDPRKRPTFRQISEIITELHSQFATTKEVDEEMPVLESSFETS